MLLLTQYQIDYLVLFFFIALSSIGYIITDIKNRDLQRTVWRLQSLINKNKKSIFGIDDEFKSELAAKGWMKEAVDKEVKRREKKIRRAIRTNLKFSEYIMFRLYEKLNDYFSDKIYIFEERGSFDTTKYCVKVKDRIIEINEKEDVFSEKG